MKYLKQKIVTLFFILLSFNTLIAQNEESAISIHRLSIGLSLNAGSFFLEGNPGGIELAVFDPYEQINSTKSKSFGIGYSIHYRTIKQLDLVYDQAAELSTELNTDTYWIMSKNFGLKYQIVNSNDLFFPFVKLSYSRYSVGAITVYDITSPYQSKKAQYIWRGQGLTWGLGIELKAGENLLYSLGYDRLVTIGNIVADEGGVEFVNKPKHGRFNFTFRFEF